MSNHPGPSPSTAEPDDSSATFTLPDGRKIGYAQYGSPIGKPIFVFHGIAGSRFDGAFFHDEGQQQNARIIGVDRPGMGLSTHQPTRTLLGFAKDVEQLADHLKLDKYSVMGISGGGPAVLACAKALPPTRLAAAAVIVGLGPPDIGMQGAQLANRIGFPYGFRYCPSFLNRWFWRLDPIGRVDLTDEQRLAMIDAKRASMHPKDQEVMTDAFWGKALKSTREAFVQGYDGVLVDGKTMCFPFGFRVEEIRKDLPVHLWYGKLDVNVPGNHGVQLKKRIGDKAVLRLEDETHASVLEKYKKEIVENLLKEM